MTTALTTAPRELGVPVKSVNWVRLYAGQTRAGRPLLLASMGQYAGGLFVCDIDLESGQCRQYSVDLTAANFPTAGFLSPTSGVLYIGSAYTGHLHRFDANLPLEQRHLEDLGPIDEELCNFPCQIDEAPDGSIYIGAYGGCSLTRFDPRSGEFTRLGCMDETDMYFYPSCGADGTVAGVVRVCNPHVVAIDPKTGEHRAVGPVFDADELQSNGSTASAITLLKGADGLLYIKSIAGNFQLRGMEAIPIDEFPEPLSASTLPDGSTVAMIDEAAVAFRTVGITAPDGSSRSINLDWQGGGTALFLMHEGPDGKIYGSSIMPEHLFVCNPDGSGMSDLGQCSLSIGEAYSMANWEGKLFIASYPQARLSIYDPALPYRFGEDESANPRDIGRLDDVAYRPRAMLAGPAGKVWIGSIPDYGMWGGTLAWYDPDTGAHRSHRHILQDCSVTSLEWLPESNLILVGTSRHGGSGTLPRAEAAAFVLWDAERDEMVWTGDFGLEKMDGVTDLKRAPDGSVYAVVFSTVENASAELVLLDVENKRVLDRSPFDDGAPLEVSLRQGPDGALYGWCVTSLYRIRPGTAQRETLWSTAGLDAGEHVTAPGPIIGRTCYFGSHHRLRAIDIN